MTFIEKRFFKKVNRNIYIAVFCIAAVFFWYNAGNKAIASECIRDVAVEIDAESDAAVDADETALITSDGSDEDEEVADSTDDVQQDEQEEEQKTLNPLYTGMFIVNVNDYLNIRAEADENGEIVGKLYAGSGGDVLENGDDWTYIQSGSVKGYVKTEYIILGTDSTDEIEAAIVGTAVVNTETLRVRAEESTDADIVTMVAEGTKLTCTGTETSSDWVGVKVNDKTGYVSAEYVTVTYKLPSAVSIEEEQAAKAAAEAAAKAEAESKAAAEAASKAAETTTAAQTTQKATETKSATTVQTASTNASVDDAYLLACLVYCEAGSEPYEGKLAVANVVLNRLHAGWGSSISEVIYASGQFTPASNGALANAIASGPNSDSTKAANAALAGTNNVSGYYHFGATSAINTGSLSNYLIIGNHVFY